MNPLTHQPDLSRFGAIEIYPLNGQPITLPRQVRWEHLAISHHQLPPGECSHALPLHLIRIALQDALPLELRSNYGHMHHHSVITGDLAFCQAHSQQWMRWLADAEFLLLWLDPILLTHLAEEAQLSGSGIELLEFEHEIQDPFILQIGLTLQRELAEEPTMLSSLYVDTLANALAAHLLKNYRQPLASKPLVFPHPEKLAHTRWQQVVDYIHEHLDHSLTIAELAAVAGMSPYHFTRSFKQTIGPSPHQYVLWARIERAKSLLLQGEEPLSVLATRLGFADQSHFTRSFKRFTGVTPQAFLQHHTAKIFHT
jgi:AraC family transcriptional regulator